MEGTDINSNFVLEILHLSLGKNNEKRKNAEGATLVEAKPILPQNNLQDVSLITNIINMLKFHIPNAHERTENEILIRFWGRRLRKTNRPSPVLIIKTANKNIFVIFMYSMLSKQETVLGKFSYH